MLLCLYSTLIPEGHSAAGAGAQCGSEHRLWCSQHQSELQIPPGVLPSQSPAVAALVPFKCLPWFKQVHYNCWGFPGGSGKRIKIVKNLPAVQETQVQLLVRKIPWRRKWQPTPVFLPGESHGQRSLVGYSPWNHKESDKTEWLTQHNITIVHSPWLLQPLPYFGVGEEISQNSWAISVCFLWPVLCIIKSYTRSSPERPWFLKALLLVSVQTTKGSSSYRYWNPQGLGCQTWGSNHSLSRKHA